MDVPDPGQQRHAAQAQQQRGGRADGAWARRGSARRRELA
jgi:hypothetical protein